MVILATGTALSASAFVEEAPQSAQHLSIFRSKKDHGMAMVEITKHHPRQRAGFLSCLVAFGCLSVTQLLWMTMLPPPIACGLAVSMSSEAPSTLS